MTLRTGFSDQLKQAMKAGQARRVSTLRLILARLKDVDIAARPRGGDPVPDAEILAMLRTMIKARREAAALYIQGKRPELAAREEEEIVVIEEFLPAALEGEALAAVVAAAIGEVGATSQRDMGKVMAALRASHGAALDMAAAGALVKAKLG